MLAKQIEASHIQISIQCCSLTLLFYDYILTFLDEVKYIWRSKLSLSTFLYIGCRYALVANIIYINILAYLNIVHDNRYVPDMDTICGVFGIIGRTSVLSVWGLRTYALYNGSKLIMAWFVSLGLACFVLHVVHVAGNRCLGQALYPLSDMILSIVLCCFEFSATLLTIIRSARTLRDLKGVDGWDNSLYHLLLKQGILYTATVSGFLIASTCLNFLYPGSLERRILNALTLPICGIMTARFLLCLRERNSDQETQGSQDVEELSQLQFVQNPTTIDSSIISEFGEDLMQQQREIASMSQENDGYEQDPVIYRPNESHC